VLNSISIESLGLLSKACSRLKEGIGVNANTLSFSQLRVGKATRAFLVALTPAGRATLMASVQEDN
jgi:hypothetical protein